MVMGRIRGRRCGRSIWRSCWRGSKSAGWRPKGTPLHVGAQQEMAVPQEQALAGFLAGADFLPAAGAAVGLQDFFAEADGFGGDFDEFVIGDEFDGLLEGIFAEDHAFVDGDGGANEELAALLDIPQSKRCRNAGTVGDQRSRG